MESKCFFCLTPFVFLWHQTAMFVPGDAVRPLVLSPYICFACLFALAWLSHLSPTRLKATVTRREQTYMKAVQDPFENASFLLC